MRAALISGVLKESGVCSSEGGKAKTLHPHSLMSMVLYAKDIVETDFLSLPPDTSVLQAAKAMATRHQGFAVVTTPDKGPVGIVTEWDVLAKVVAQARDPAHVHLAEIMTSALVAVDPHEGTYRIARPTAEEGTRRVLTVKHAKGMGDIRARALRG